MLNGECGVRDIWTAEGNKARRGPTLARLIRALRGKWAVECGDATAQGIAEGVQVGGDAPECRAIGGVPRERVDQC